MEIEVLKVHVNSGDRGPVARVDLAVGPLVVCGVPVWRDRLGVLTVGKVTRTYTDSGGSSRTLVVAEVERRAHGTILKAVEPQVEVANGRGL